MTNVIDFYPAGAWERLNDMWRKDESYQEDFDIAWHDGLYGLINDEQYRNMFIEDYFKQSDMYNQDSEHSEPNYHKLVQLWAEASMVSALYAARNMEMIDDWFYEPFDKMIEDSLA